jgi:hypothetical protein
MVIPNLLAQAGGVLAVRNLSVLYSAKALLTTASELHLYPKLPAAGLGNPK